MTPASSKRSRFFTRPASGSTLSPPLNTTDNNAVPEWLDVATWRSLDYETTWRVSRGELDLLAARFHLDSHGHRHEERLLKQVGATPPGRR